jgi:hypothetical protein
MTQPLILSPGFDGNMGIRKRLPEDIQLHSWIVRLLAGKLGDTHGVHPRCPVAGPDLLLRLLVLCGVDQHAPLGQPERQVDRLRPVRRDVVVTAIRSHLVTRFQP